MKRSLILGFISLVLFSAHLAFTAPQGVPKHIIFKGLNTKAGPLSLDDGESPDCLNVHTNIFGTLIKRLGYDKLNDAHTHVTTSPGKVNGLFDYAIDSWTRKLIRYFDNELYKMDGLDGAFDPLQVVGVAPSNNIAEFANFEGTLLFNTWSRDGIRYWNGSTSTYDHVQVTPVGKHIVVAYNRVFLGDIVISGTTYELRFYYTDAGTYATMGTNSYETLDAPAGDRLMGFGLLRGRLFGFAKYAVNLISDVGGSDPIEVNKRLAGTGCGAPRTIKTIVSPIMGESLIWLTNDKRLVMYNGSTLIDVSERVYTNNNQSPFAMSLINTGALEKSHAVVDEAKGWYRLFVPISSSVDYELVYDYKTNTLWPMSNQNFESSAVVETTTGNFVYCGDRTGGVFQLDSTNADDGSNINGYWTSRKWDFGFAPYLKKMGEVQIVTKTIGNYNLSYQYRYNWDTSWTTAENLTMTSGGAWLLGDNLPATLGTRQAQTHRLTIPSAFNLFQIKVSNNTSNPSFEVYGLQIISTNLGSVGE